MSTPAKKHAAEQEQVSTSSKRPATGTAEYVTLEDEENCTYHLTVKLHSKYDVFPAQLRATVQKAYKETIRQQMDLLTYGPDSQERPERTYTLSIERRVKSSSSANTSSSPQNLDEQPGTTVVRSALTTLSLANTMLLGLFLDKFKPVAGQVIFVELRTKEGLANPDFAMGVHHDDGDAPARFELFLLGEDQSKVEYKEETRVPNTAIFTFNKEDHTLGNLLSQRLLKYDYIVFSAYKVPHPLFATFELRVSTDGSITPKDAIIRCCKDVVGDLEELKKSFNTEWLGKKIVSEGEAERVAREQQNY